MENPNNNPRTVPLEMTPEEFRVAGYALVNEISTFLGTIRDKPVTPAETPTAIQHALGDDSLPETGEAVASLLPEACRLLMNHSLLNGHPRFWGYITSSAAPIGALADLLASAVNANVGAFALSPMATEIERQTIRWIATLIGFPSTCGGILVSGGNVANFVGLLAARKNKSHWDVSSDGFKDHRFTIYCAEGTHTWIQKGADTLGIGTAQVRWIPVDDEDRMRTGALQARITADREAGYHPLMVVGNAGSVGTGAVDPLMAISRICTAEQCWFHIDGAYGAPAAALPEFNDRFEGLAHADSIALDPHKWLYSPLEAGCILVREERNLHNTFHYQPSYYRFEGSEENPVVNFHEYGLQNSRGFRALKVWLGLKQAGRQGYLTMIRDDISLARYLFEIAGRHPQLQAVSCNLSITTFRFVPEGSAWSPAYLNQLNEALVKRLQESGEIFLSQALVRGAFCLRVCIVNFRTTRADIAAIPEIVCRHGNALHGALKQQQETTT